MTATPTRAAGPVDTTASPYATWKALRADAVTIGGGIWAKRQAVNRDSALPHGFRMLEAAGNFEDLRIAAGRSDAPYRGPVFMDSDVYKWIEAASFELARRPSDELATLVERATELVEAAQQDDGYLNSYYQVVAPDRRWTEFDHGHELYCAGHLIQAAVAHHRATGSDRLLRVARRFADHIDGLFGPGRQGATCGHPEIEMALVKLYRETCERRYLDLAGAFVDRRGHGWLGPGGRFNSSAYYQDRVPVRETTELEGHAVRALYLTAGVTDLYLETGERALLDALERQWQDLVTRKLYVTGGVGSRHHAEAVGQPYELPNELAYCETCAAIASVLWCWRMLQATGEARFADLAERTLYNAVLSGISLDGERYSYVNPLANNGAEEHLHRGGPRRKPWHNVACCPPNVMRLFASLGHYVATRDDQGLQVHQYGPVRIATDLGSGQAVALRMAGDYPWDGRIRLTIEDADGRPWTLSLRVPAWCDGATARVNGEEVEAAPGPNGYLRIERPWSRGDVAELDLPMAPRLIEARPWIESTRGCVAIEHGPLVYCLEQADQQAPVYDLEIDATAPLETTWRPDLLDGVSVVRAAGFRIDRSAWQDRLYRPLASGDSSGGRPAELTAIPYYAWANREPGAMRVWIPRG
ncbi:MAG: glycoside hydrolase family 127 protein [Chloroflexota bacterium]|nr:glycoside hydrolase family 127 protein [Chloroflexota bacterium]